MVFSSFLVREKVPDPIFSPFEEHAIGGIVADTPVTLSMSSGAGHHDAYILAGGLNVREKRVWYPALYIAPAATVGTPLFLQLRTNGALPADEDFN